MINNLYRLKYPKTFEKVYTELDITSNVIIRPSYLSICKADQRYYQGKRDSKILDEKLPMALIHEAVGTVIKDNNHEFKPGDNVILIPNNPQEKNKDIFANYLPTSKFRGSNFDGFSSDLLSQKNDRLIKVPNNLNLELASFIELISVAVHGINRFEKIAHIKKDILGVWGDGNLGYIISLLLKNIYPNSKVIVFGKHAENLNRFSFVDETYKINNIPSDLAIDHAFEAVGSMSSETAIEQIINLSNPQAIISLFGVSEFAISINTRLILEKGLTLIGSSRSERNDFIQAIKLLENNPKMISYLNNLINKVIDIKDLNDLNYAFEYDYNNSFGKTILNWKI